MTGAYKPISWQVNGSCTASLYLFLKGLFKTERQKERQRERQKKRVRGQLMKVHIPHVDVHCNEISLFAFKPGRQKKKKL